MKRPAYVRYVTDNLRELREFYELTYVEAADLCDYIDFLEKELQRSESDNLHLTVNAGYLQRSEGSESSPTLDDHDVLASSSDPQTPEGSSSVHSPSGEISEGSGTSVTAGQTEPALDPSEPPVNDSDSPNEYQRGFTNGWTVHEMVENEIKIGDRVRVIDDHSTVGIVNVVEDHKEYGRLVFFTPDAPRFGAHVYWDSSLEKVPEKIPGRRWEDAFVEHADKEIDRLLTVQPTREDHEHMESPAAYLYATDPFDKVLIDIVNTNRRKRKDYANDGDAFSNFRTSSSLLGLAGFGPTESALFNVGQKLARLKSLRENGRMEDTANEAVADTYLDLAVYAVIAYAIYKDGNK